MREITNPIYSGKLDEIQDPVERLRYMSTGKVTTAEVSWVTPNGIRKAWIAKVRGIPIAGSSGRMFRFATHEDALLYGQDTRARWQRELKDLMKGKLL